MSESELWSRWRARRRARAQAAGETSPDEQPAEQSAGASPRAEAGAAEPAPEPEPEPPPTELPPEPDPGPDLPPVDPFTGWGDAHSRAYEEGASGAGHECVEWCPICRTADVVRASVSPEVREQWRDVQREGLTILRSAIDHYIQHLEQDLPAEPPPEDGPGPGGEAP